MAFSLKTWVNRISEYPNRRKLTHEDGSTELVTVARAEGQISAEGNAFSAEEMNDLENRIKGGFDEVNQSLTEKINALVQKLHPVGSWYFSTVATNPVDIFGFGTWQLITDRFLVGAGNSYFSGAMGGEAVHTLTAAELPTHQHNVLSGTLGGNNGNYKFMLSSQSMYGTYDGQYGVITDDRFITAASSVYCGNQPHNNIPPYYAIYMWVRTA